MTDPGPIPPFLDRRPLVGTYTMLSCFENICQYQAYRRYVVRDIKFVPTPASEYGNEVHTAFEHRIGGGKPLPEKMQQWEPLAQPFDGRGAQVELKIGLTKDGVPCGYFDNNVVRWRVKVDTLVLNPDKTFAYLCDWKTGNSKYEDPFELAIGAMHVHALYPSLQKIAGQYAWLRDNRLGQSHDLTDTNATWQKASAILGKMEAAKASGEWPKRQSPLCAHCDVLDCENNKRPQSH